MPFSSKQDAEVLAKFVNQAKKYFDKHNKTFICGIFVMDRDENPKRVYYGNLAFTNADIADLEIASLAWQREVFRATENLK